MSECFGEVMRKAIGFSLGVLVSVASATVACNSPQRGEVQSVAPLDMEVMDRGSYEDESVEDRWVQRCNIWKTEAEDENYLVVSKRVVNSAGYTSGDKVLANAPIFSYEVNLVERGSRWVVKELPLEYMPDTRLNLNGTKIEWFSIGSVYRGNAMDGELYANSYDYESGKRESRKFVVEIKKEEKPSQVHSWMGPHEW